MLQPGPVLVTGNALISVLRTSTTTQPLNPLLRRFPSCISTFGLVVVNLNLCTEGAAVAATEVARSRRPALTGLCLRGPSARWL